MSDKNYLKSCFGTDVGGTFTDCVFLRDGQLIIDKVFSTPDDPSDAVIEVILRQRRAKNSHIEFIHGTTVATNAILERKIDRVVLVTTKGFKHVLHIGRQQRPSLYDPTRIRSEPLVTEEDCCEVEERIGPDGDILVPLNKKSVNRLLSILKKNSPGSIAISLLYSFRNPKHEQALAKQLAGDSKYSISLSSDISPAIREYERTSTTVLDAAVKPIVEKYINKLETRLNNENIGPVSVMQSNGGINHPEAIIHKPVSLVLSGPAGGVSACRYLSEITGQRNLIGLDMGGTSTDVSLIHDGHITTVEEGSIGGHPLQLPMINIVTIGAGGGSIAWIDQGGLLRVGPQSAGADPGPICYNKGGRELTVSDANVLLGFLPVDHFLGGTYTLDSEKAQKAAHILAGSLHLSYEQTICGIYDVVNISMLRALNVISSKQGLDPRNFSLVAFGGAGPLHASALAREIGIKQVIVPFGAGLFSAFGLLVSDIMQDFTLSHSINPNHRNVNKVIHHNFAVLEKQAESSFSTRNIQLRQENLHRKIYLRFKGQDNMIAISWEGSLDRLLEQFMAEHHQRYGYILERNQCRIIRQELRVIIPRPRVSLHIEKDKKPQISTTRLFDRDKRQWISVPLIIRESLPPDFSLTGPAIITEKTATTVVLDGDKAIVDRWGNILIEITE